MSRITNAFVALVIAAGLGIGCSAADGSGASAPAAAASNVVPTDVATFDLMLDGVVDLPSYQSDRAAGLNTCARSKTGGWSYLYGGGSPFVAVDLSIFSGVMTGSNPSDFNLGIDVRDSAVRVVPSGRLEGAKGTGTASVMTTADEIVITIEGSSITRQGSAVDHGATDVALTVHCPIATP